MRSTVRLAVVLGVLATASTRADSIVEVQSFSFDPIALTGFLLQPLEFSPFDPSLGQLTTIDYSLDSQFQGATETEFNLERPLGFGVQAPTPLVGGGTEVLTGTGSVSGLTSFDHTFDLMDLPTSQPFLGQDAIEFVPGVLAPDNLIEGNYAGDLTLLYFFTPSGGGPIQTVEQTVSFSLDFVDLSTTPTEQVLLFDPFDEALGELTSVSYDVDSNLTANTEFGIETAPVFAGVSAPFGLLPIEFFLNEGGPGPGVVSENLNGGQSFIPEPPPEFDPFETVTFTAFIDAEETSFTGFYTGELLLRYNFEAGDSPDPVPEPTTLLLLGTSLGVVAYRRRRRH